MQPHAATRPRVAIRAIAVFGLLSVPLALAPVAAAHDRTDVGTYHVTIGWHVEPTFVGQPNAVEVTIQDHHDQPVNDLAPGDLKVVISTADQQTAELPLDPAFDLDEGFGTPGQYTADILPTTTGEYTFHITGSIHAQPVDLEVSSGDQTFEPVTSSSDVEFPVKVPTLADVATRLDRIDGRIETLQASAIDPQQLADLQAGINDARNAADRATTTGMLVGGAGLVVAAIALVLAWRASRRSARPA
jgi:hypothetical protein